MTMNLAKCLIRFMLGKYRTVADCEKAFLRILIKVDHRDALRFHWPKNPASLFSPLEVWRFKVVLFGSISSPFLLAIVLDKVIAEDITNTIVRKTLQSSIYVDNLVVANNNIKINIKLYQSREVFLKRGFNLREWTSNFTQVQELAKKDKVYNDKKKVIVLGMIWDVEQSEMSFKNLLAWDSKNTKRSVLSFTNAMFDPLNRLLPIAIMCRVIIRTLWDANLKWDLDFTKNTELSERFATIRKQVFTALKHKYNVETQVYSNTEIQCFSDASTSAFGAVLYLLTPPCIACTNGSIK